MNNKRILVGRAGLAGLLLTLSAIVFTAGPSGAAETYSLDRKLSSTWTVDYQPAFTAQDLTAARIARVGITPIPIP